jgi:hypothetical protein
MYLGQGVVGVAVCIIRGICIFIFESSNNNDTKLIGTLIFFILSALVLMLAAGLYFTEEKNPFV